MHPLLAEAQLTLSVGLVAACALAGLVFALLDKVRIACAFTALAVVLTLFR